MIYVAQKQIIITATAVTAENMFNSPLIDWVSCSAGVEMDLLFEEIFWLT